VPPPNTDDVTALARQLSARWEGIDTARAKTVELRERLRANLGELDDPNCSLIVTGSLGRREANERSDADWVLLVDGPSNPDHARMAREIVAAVARAGFKDVGPTGTFGDVVASHDLVHNIAGTRDTNENLTRRMLLLAESHAILGPLVRQRVIRNILTRYVELDRPVLDFHPIPHFMLNDVVRYWRTIASDYASKMWERDHRGWATRNIKLRFSRKLLFAWGLLAAFAGKLFPSPSLERAEARSQPDEYVSLLTDLIREQTDVTPLELVARAASHPDVTDQVRCDIFDSYDAFLTIMSDRDKRDHLDRVAFSDASSDPVYGELRRLSHGFRRGINNLFFDEHPDLRVLIRKFGVF
jgi:hypothetical protein